MAKQYISVEKSLSPRPRSKRRRETGEGTSSGNITVILNGGGGTSVPGETQTNKNKGVLDKLGIDGEGYGTITVWKENKDGDLEKATEKIKAGYADKAGVAQNLAEDSSDWQTIDDKIKEQASLLDERFLSKIHDDEVQGNITFDQSVHSKGFVSGLLDGKGWGILPDGTAQFASLLVQQMRVLDLVVNRVRGIDGDIVLAESDTVVSVERLAQDTYRLHLDDKWDGYFTSQCEGNVLMGVFNILPAYAAGLSGVRGTEAVETEGDNPYFTSWSRVISVNAEPGDNYVDVVLWDAAKCPAGVNFPPCARMNVVRRGNVDATNHADRQNVIFLSSTEGRIMMLTHVDQPILEDYMYGYALGSVPDFVKENPKVRQYMQDGRSYLYIDGIICNQIIEADKPAAPTITYVQYETWDSSGQTFYHFRTANGQTDEWGNAVIEQSDVWHYGIMWRCLVDGTGDEPRWNSPSWQQMTGSTDMEIRFYDADGFEMTVIPAVPGNVDVTITPRLLHGGMDITADTPDADWSWQRSTKSGEGLDAAWNRAHEGTRALRVTDDDMPTAWNRHNPVLLRCSVRVWPEGDPVEKAVRIR